MAKTLDPMDLKQIIRLHLDGFSNREIAKTLGIGRNAVNAYMQKFTACDLTLKNILKLAEADLKELFSSKTTIDNQRYNLLMKYFEKVKLAKDQPGFTFKYHYLEYQATTENPYGYTQFMEHYNRKFAEHKGSMKLDHLAGYNLMIDFAGKPLYITDKETGELIAVDVFVSILPCSQYTYVEACRSQKREDLITCVINALEYYGGVPKAIISDNLKSAVSRSSKYEPQINKSLKDLAHHYGCVINPTRAYSPQDKALVESAVNLAYQRIYYPLRNMVFFSLADLNKEIRHLLIEYNDVLFQRKGSSRRELFQSIERSQLKALPLTAYEMKDYRRAKVQKMGYVFFSPDQNYYSVPCKYIGYHTQIHYTNTWVEVFYNNKRIATHKRMPIKGEYITKKEHLASTHQEYKDWSPEYFRNMAKPHGESVVTLVNELLSQFDYPEIGYKRAMGIIQLHKQYSSQRLNNACQRALYTGHIGYNRVKEILKEKLDKEYQLFDQLQETKPHIPKHENIRGRQMYN